MTYGPVVTAWPVRDEAVCALKCPFCLHLHFHGRGPGARRTHCNAPGSENGYVLVMGEERSREDLYREFPLPVDRLYRPARRTRSPISPRIRARVMERDGFRCRRCGAGPNDDRLVLDHIMPVALGGSDDESNLQTLCETCNLGKSDALPHPHDLRR